MIISTVPNAAPRMKTVYIFLAVLASLCAAQATSPALSVNVVPPGTLKFSWPTNYTNWQLISATNLSSANWNSVTQATFLSNNLLTVLFPMTNQRSFFRLQQTNSGGGCIFQATPPIITGGGSSLLTWCTVAGTTYRVTPGPGIVTGGSLSVTPSITTTYTLTASNSTGIVTNFATVIVNPCGFASVSNWDGTINFTYNLAPSSGPYSYNISQTAQITFHLSFLSGSGGTVQYSGIPAGTASVNDTEVDSSSGITTTDIGTSLPRPDLSSVLLSIDCASNSYQISGVVFIDATTTVYSSGPPSSSPSTPAAGLFVAGLLPLPTDSSSISFSGTLPVHGPFWTAGGSYYEPDSSLANDMFIYGVVTDTTAGNVTISWTLTPSP
jgi:hypothetical protein